MEYFDGFPPEALTFLAELGENNSREWFEPRKEQYEAQVRTPALRFIAAMSEPLQEIAPHFLALPKKSGGSLMRPYRDIRFSRDKTPYKTNVGIQFRHHAGKDVHAPGYYVHIAPDGCFLGVGLWKPPAEPLLSIRTAISDRSDEYTAILKDLVVSQSFTMEGESLKRPPRGFDPEHPLIEEIKRKDFIASHEIDSNVATSPDLISTVTESFTNAGPFMRFLCRAVGLTL